MEKKCHFCKGGISIKEVTKEVKAVAGPEEKVTVFEARCTLDNNDCPILDIYEALNQIAIAEGLRISRESL